MASAAMSMSKDVAVQLFSQLRVSQYLNLASLAAFIWDFSLHVDEDFRLLFRKRIRTSTVGYFVSRIATLAYILTVAVYQIGPAGNCQVLVVVIGVCFAIAVPATSYLFLLRIYAIFNGERSITWSFTFLWLIAAGAAWTCPFAISGSHTISPTFCMDTMVKPYVSAGIIASTAFDTFVFIAITWRLLHNSAVDDNYREKVRTFFGGGNALPRISKSLLHGGQVYYLITVIGNIASMALILSPSIPPILRCLLPVPNLTIESCMACKVFRDIRLGVEPGFYGPDDMRFVLPFPLSLSLSEGSQSTGLSSTLRAHGSPSYVQSGLKASLSEQ